MIIEREKKYKNLVPFDATTKKEVICPQETINNNNKFHDKLSFLTKSHSIQAKIDRYSETFDDHTKVTYCFWKKSHLL